MADYWKMYCILFNAITDALVALESRNPGKAAALLKIAQQTGEELYIEDDSPQER